MTVLEGTKMQGGEIKVKEEGREGGRTMEGGGRKMDRQYEEEPEDRNIERYEGEIERKKKDTDR